MTSAIARRIAAVERLAERRRPAPEADFGEAAIVAEWRELSRAGPCQPSPLPVDIAAMTDVEAVEEWRRLARGDDP